LPTVSASTGLIAAALYRLEQFVWDGGAPGVASHPSMLILFTALPPAQPHLRHEHHPVCGMMETHPVKHLLGSSLKEKYTENEKRAQPILATFLGVHIYDPSSKHYVCPRVCQVVGEYGFPPISTSVFQGSFASAFVAILNCHSPPAVSIDEPMRHY
jgi:hypothetical protein